MVAKQISRRKRSAGSVVVTLVPELADDAAVRPLESERASGAASIDSERRRQMVAAAAYFRAERRGFDPGHELEDWVAAEAAVDAQLQDGLAA